MQTNQVRIAKTLTRLLRVKLKANNKKNATSNTVSEIQISESDQNADTNERENDWNNLPDMVMTSDNSDTGDTDRTE